MKDYSMSSEERKDFILGYDITKDGQMIIKFAKGEHWVLPYNEENEKKLLQRMTEQVKVSDKKEEKLKENFERLLMAIRLICVTIVIFNSGSAILSLFFPCIFLFLLEYGYVECYVLGGVLLLGLITFIKNINILNDLKRNKKFLKMEEKLNNNIRSNQNVLANVSNKTKRTIKDFPKDKSVFNINSFNYVPFKDLEQIMENVERNERFGFDYTEQEQVKGKTRKRTR